MRWPVDIYVRAATNPFDVILRLLKLGLPADARKRLRLAPELSVIAASDQSLFAVDSLFKEPEKGPRVAVSEREIWVR